jgi:DNA-directed RNA polymerase specialized sigma24 family protein
MKISEIEKVLDLNSNTVKTRLARGRSMLKKKMKGELDEWTGN